MDYGDIALSTTQRENTWIFWWAITEKTYRKAYSQIEIVCAINIFFACDFCAKCIIFDVCTVHRRVLGIGQCKCMVILKDWGISLIVVYCLVWKYHDPSYLKRWWQVFPSNVDLLWQNFDKLRRIRCNSWTMPWKRSATVWPSFISVSWSVLRFQLDGWASMIWVSKKFLYFGMLLGFPKNFTTKITWNSLNHFFFCTSALIFKAYIGTNVGRRVIPPVFHSSFQTSQNRRSVGFNRAILTSGFSLWFSRLWPWTTWGLPTIQHLLWREDKCRDFHWCHRLRIFFCWENQYKNAKMWRISRRFGYLIDVEKKSQWVEISEANLISIVFSNTRRFFFGVAFRKLPPSLGGHVLGKPELGFKKRWVEYIWMFPKIVVPPNHPF